MKAGDSYIDRGTYPAGAKSLGPGVRGPDMLKSSATSYT